MLDIQDYAGRVSQMNAEITQAHLCGALAEFYERDAGNLLGRQHGRNETAAHERALVFRIAVYLASRIEPASNGRLFVDVEFNRLGAEPKPNRKVPDLIVHDRRGSRASGNILIVEAKAFWTQACVVKDGRYIYPHIEDIEKLRLLGSEIHYERCLYLYLDRQNARLLKVDPTNRQPLDYLMERLPTALTREEQRGLGLEEVSLPDRSQPPRANVF